jgi:hypothetical protein
MLLTLFSAGALLALSVNPDGDELRSSYVPGPELEADEGDATEEQLSPAGATTPEPLTPVPEPVSVCPSGMVHVQGAHCSALAQECQSYVDQKKDRCASFFPTSVCLGKDQPLQLCIDRFEYPNEPGTKPELGINWDEAVDLCRSRGKRLCTEAEWTLACEGPGRLPYPYGYVRDSEACNIDKAYLVPDNQRYADPETRAAEVKRLDQREPSGSRAACVSGYGVFDLTGNADEWVLFERGSHIQAPFKSALKGGYWGPVRNRCRPMTATHNRWHSGYQIGTRCCRDLESTLLREQ